jgi:hypothetical protein
LPSSLISNLQGTSSMGVSRHTGEVRKGH